jgi:hypothetical protein
LPAISPPADLDTAAIRPHNDALISVGSARFPKRIASNRISLLNECRSVAQLGAARTLAARPIWRTGGTMPFKPNYRMQRSDRARAKAQKQEKKLARRAEKVAQRKTGPDEPESAVPQNVENTGDGS